MTGWTSSYFPVRVEADLVGVGAVLTETTEQRAAAKALSHSATHDALTGLPNRVLFVDRVGMAMAQAARAGSVAAVLFCDIDRFKLINDSLGHPAGDDLLRLAAARLSRLVRPGDTVARLGGDEFALICTSVADIAEARTTAERVCAVLREPMQIRGRVITSTASVGVALCGAGQRDVQKVLRDADVAMYQAKDAGRDQVAMFDERVHGDAAERLEFQGALRKAVERNHITVNYQPIVHLGGVRAGVGSDGFGGDGAWASGGGSPAGRDAVGVEALARWYRPGHGPVSPAVFIPTAEDLGLIHALGAGVLRQACANVRRWRDELHRPITAAVNLSARQLASETCVSSIAAMLDDAGLPPSALQLEITESVLMVDLEHSRSRLFQLRDLGVSLAIDDFGTGYSSLAYLRDLPVDVLKIDRSFTSRLPADAAMFSFIVDLARALGATTVVEGVETLEQLRLVAQLGCDHAQGYYLSRPLDAEEAAQFLLGASATTS